MAAILRGRGARLSERIERPDLYARPTGKEAMITIGTTVKAAASGMFLAQHLFDEQPVLISMIWGMRKSPSVSEVIEPRTMPGRASGNSTRKLRAGVAPGWRLLPASGPERSSAAWTGMIM